MRKPKESADKDMDSTTTIDMRDNVKIETATAGKSLTPPAASSNKTMAEAKSAKEVTSALAKAAAVAATNDKQKVETKPSPKGTTTSSSAAAAAAVNTKVTSKESPKEAGKKR